MSDAENSAWMLSRRSMLSASVTGTCLAAIASVRADNGKSQLETELYQTADPSELLAAAKAIAALDTHGTFITTDAAGMPRARAMSADFGDTDGAFWMLTMPGSRKLTQLAHSPRSLLHFADTEQWGYVSFMGTTRIHTDKATIAKRAFFPQALQDSLFPDFPADVVALEFVAEVIEVAGRGASVHASTWQPQGLML